MICMLTGAIINTILDPLFIFGFHWGIKGAAWATVIGQIASGCLVIVYFVRFKKMGLTAEMLKPRGMYIKGILTLGMASCINQIAMAIVQIVLNNTLRYYGSLSVYGSDIPLACVGVIACSIIKTPDWLASLGKTDTDCHKHHIDFCNYTDTRQWNI